MKKIEKQFSDSLVKKINSNHSFNDLKNEIDFNNAPSPKKRFPLWAKIAVPSLSAVAIIGIVFAIVLSTIGINRGRNKGNDFTGQLNKENIGESYINDISKYTAIGVGHKKQNKQPNDTINYAYFDDTENGEEESGNDYSNFLVGVTNEGMVEQLSMTSSDGSSIALANRDITFFENLGDFALVTVWPFSRDVTLSMVGGIYNELLIKSLNEVKFFVPYAIRYLNESTNEYEYIDTTYLIHKRSGYIYPFSLHSQYIDAKDIHIEFIGDYSWCCAYQQEAWFTKRNSEIENERIMSILFNEIFFRVGDLLDFENDFYRVTFNNGFWLEDEGITTCLEYNEQTHELDVSSYNNLSFEYSDKYGNLRSYGLLFNKKTQKLERIKEVSDFERQDTLNMSKFEFAFDFPTKSFYYHFRYEVEDDGGNTIGKEEYVFTNEELNEDYRLVNDGDFGWWIPSWRDYRDIRILKIDELHEYRIFDEKLYLVTFDDNGRYIGGELVLESSNIRDAIFANGCFYYVNSGQVHKINPSNNYEDTVIVSATNYFINDIRVDDFGYIVFFGIDENRNEVSGYITSDDEVSFEIKETSTYSVTSISPIN